jgi:hypothetical protein
VLELVTNFRIIGPQAVMGVVNSTLLQLLIMLFYLFLLSKSEFLTDFTLYFGK